MVADSAGLLKAAVHQNSLTSRRGILERMFTLFFDGFVYNQIWEDPRVDLEALELTSESRVLTISSGGCNVLNYLTARPESVTAVDLNPYHMYVTRLKLATLEFLPDYEAFFMFWGEADSEANVRNYHRFISHNLDSRTRHFWEDRRGLLGPRIGYFARNFYDHGRNGWYLRFVHMLAKVVGCDLSLILRAESLAEQHDIFDRTLAPFFDNRAVKALSKLPFIVFGLGIPPRQYEALMEDSGGDLLAVCRDRIRKLACDFPATDNYFLWQSFTRRYDREGKRALPEYLKPENHDLLREQVRNVKSSITSVTHWLRGQPDESLDRFVFLDAQEWMKPNEIEALWQLVARVGRPGTRIIFRTAASKSTVEGVLSPVLRERFVYERERSQELFERDRASIYGGFHLYGMP